MAAPMATNSRARPKAAPVDAIDDGMDDPMASPSPPHSDAENASEEHPFSSEDDNSDDEMIVDVDDDDDDDNDAAEDDGSEDLEEAGIPLSPSEVPTTAAPANSLPSTTDAPSTADAHLPSLDPQKPTPYTYDAGHLLIVDPNPLPTATTTNAASLEATLQATARDAAQALLNHLLTTCAIKRMPQGSSSGSGVEMALPAPETQLPREKRMPVAKPPTKWEQFAARKGIRANKRREDRGKMVYSEEKGEWVPKWGYKGKNKDAEGDWLVEVDEKKEREKGLIDPRSLKRAERKELVRKNERHKRKNEKMASKTR